MGNNNQQSLSFVWAAKESFEWALWAYVYVRSTQKGEEWGHNSKKQQASAYKYASPFYRRLHARNFYDFLGENLSESL